MVGGKLLLWSWDVSISNLPMVEKYWKEAENYLKSQSDTPFLANS